MATSSYAMTARRYAEAVVAGNVPACRWVKLACQRQLNDLARFKGKSSPYRFNPKLSDRSGKDFAPADNLCALIERLPHVKGPLAGEPITLEPWQVFILTTVFGWVQADGRRRFRRSYIEVPRGNAKSTLSSAVGLYMLAADGEGGAEVYSLATTRDQARIVFGDAQTMARRSAGFRSRFGVAVGAHNMNVLASGSKFEALSAEGSTLDGLNIHFGCVDELHAHKTRTVYDVVETGTGKRNNSLLWVITTAGSNRAGICYEIRSFVTKLLEGVFEDDSQFGIVYGLDDGDDWTTEEALIKANPNWGISVQPEVLVPLQAKAMQLPSAVNNFKTKHLNEWVNADTAWMDMRAWDRCADTALDLDTFAGQPCWIGLDLASKTDIAALMLLFAHPEIEGGYAIFGRYYLPEDTVMATSNSQYAGWMRNGRLTVTPGNVIDFGWIEADLIEMSSRFQVQGVAFDPFQATQLSTRMLAEGLPMIEVRPTVLNFSEPMKALEALVLQRRLIHDGDPVLGWMASNVVAHLDAKDNIYPRKERPENKIDGIVALIMALSRALVGDGTPKMPDDYTLMIV
ncbi:phage terminase large subunit-like protein [Paraburkholderia eburnea]|uniref:Phage terminase large subunit-like protein n=1 Tax=Paraburkholderia eburnea TaxID=1189126 RepID=A0A2S4LXH4_9BURK|nr:terminase TerL endonuclease subunit [Paraburkholderia eburnea]POR47069.1 phage terminase large subunit-like protein [Paraburkholderia eburnea]PRZ18299.1 phage terminase large subunit-like protein [Paraburkholderia eburnea]